MIIVRFQGGLGNQMSQFAFYRKLQSLYGEDLVRADLAYYQCHQAHNGFELNQVFPGTTKCFVPLSRKEIAKVTKLIPEKYSVESVHSFPNNFLEYLRIHVNGQLQKYYQKVSYNRMLEQDVSGDVYEQAEFYHLDAEKDWYLDGYWYQYDYSNVWKQLKNDFQFPGEQVKCHKKLTEQMQLESSVSIHVRGGDYLKTSYAVLGKRYYKQAVEEIRSRVSNPRFYIFSDSMEYAMKLLDFLKPEEVVLVDENRGKDAWRDLYLMSCCRHHIMANSTFSMWAAMLTYEKGTVIVAPQYETKTRKYAVQAEWIQLGREWLELE